MKPRLHRLRLWAEAARRHALALRLAAADPRTPWLARALAVAVVAYALSPIDLIPEFLPVIGLLDDLVLLPLGVLLVIRLLPPGVWADARASAANPGVKPADPDHAPKGNPEDA